MGGENKGGNGRQWAATVGVVAVLCRLLPPIAAFASPDIHSEYVKFASGKDTITAYLAYPERGNPAPTVIVSHEIFGMLDLISQTTEQLAKDGCVAIAPDVLSRRAGPPPPQVSARKLLAGVNPD